MGRGPRWGGSIGGAVVGFAGRPALGPTLRRFVEIVGGGCGACGRDTAEGGRKSSLASSPFPFPFPVNFPFILLRKPRFFFGTCCEARRAEAWAAARVAIAGDAGDPVRRILEASDSNFLNSIEGDFFGALTSCYSRGAPLPHARRIAACCRLRGVLSRTTIPRGRWAELAVCSPRLALLLRQRHH